MSVHLKSQGVIELLGRCDPDDAEALQQHLLANPGATIEWSGCEHLHAAVVQVLLVGAPLVRGAPTAVVAPRVQAAEPARMMAHSLHRVERAIHGLEKFQPLIESRIEALEDAFQRKYADAYASGEDVSPSPVQVRQDRGAFF